MRPKGRKRELAFALGERECEPWETALASILSDPRLELRKRRAKDGALPKIVNMVSTVSLMPAGYKVPLETLATHLGPCSQYAPQQFAANILKICDSTGLLFSSGKLLLTAALTKMHVLYASHLFRLFMEAVPYNCARTIISQPEGSELASREGQPVSQPISLAGRTIFADLSIHNIVGHGHFAFTVNLQRLRDSYADSIEWVPDNFPAARCKVWVHEDQCCHCGFNPRTARDDTDTAAAAAGAVVVRKHLKRKCRCIIKCLVFANGSIVMIGGKETANVNYVFFYMRELCASLSSSSSTTMTKKTLLLLAKTTPRKEVLQKPLDPALAVAYALAAACDFKDKTRIKRVPNDTIFMYLADAGRLEAVRAALSFEPALFEQRDAKGKNAIERLKHVERTPQQDAVLDYLEHYAANALDARRAT